MATWPWGSQRTAKISAAGAAMVRWTSMRAVIGESFQYSDRPAGRFGIFVVGYTCWLMRNHAGSSAAQPQTLRRAIVFIHENAHRDIGLSDIAAAINVTPRSVQYMFRRHLGTTPLEYLRRVRLDRAHRDLQAADPAVDTVMAIAGRWQFGHPGRFSIAYKEAFGTPPSRTLRA